jgi:FkbM family methyltransferase
MKFVAKALALVLTAVAAAVPRGRIRFELFSLVAKLGRNVPRRLLAVPGGVVVHAGVWRIETIEQWSKLVGNDGRLVAIEADRANFENLHREIDRRAIRNVELINKAVWNESTRLKFQVSTISAWGKLKSAGVEVDPQRFNAEIEVAAEPLDCILTELNVASLDHLTLTVNGAELEALAGAKALLAQATATVSVRISHPDAAFQDRLADDVRAALGKAGYSVATLISRQLDFTGSGNDASGITVYAFPPRRRYVQEPATSSTPQVPLRRAA